MDGRVLLRSLRMENFGCFQDRTISFQPGLNQLIGPNESGKSTIIRALYTVLFEDGPTSKKAIAEQKHWTGEGSFRLTLIFTVGDKEFMLIRDYGMGQDIMSDNDGLMYEGRAIREKLTRYFGTANRRLFEAVFSFSSDYPDALEGQRTRVKAALETPLFSGFDRTRADAYLEEQIKSLDNPRAHGPRELDTLGERIQECLRRKRECDDRLSSLERAGQERRQAQEQVKQNEEEIGRLERLVAGAEAYQHLDQKMGGLEERLQTHLTGYSRAVQTAETLEKLEKELNHLNAPPADELVRIVARRDELAGLVDSAKQRMDVLIERRNATGRAFWGTGSLLAVVCLVYVLQSLGAIPIGDMGKTLSMFLWAMAAIWTGCLGMYLYRIRGKKEATSHLRKVNARLNSFYADLNNFYDLKSADPVKSLTELDNRRQALELKIQSLRETIAVISDNKGIPGLVSVKEQLETEVALANKELATLVVFAPYAGRLAELKDELTACRVRRNAYADQAASLSERCSSLATLEQEKAVVEAELEMLKRRHRDLTEQLEVLHITRSALNRAADRLIEQTFQDFNDDASRHLATLTNGRHDRLRLSAENGGRFELEIHQTGKWLPLGEHLSSSTRDAIYLALRQAAMDRVASDFAVPVVFDQADVRMDRTRRNAFAGLLAALADERQVIYCATETTRPENSANIIYLDLVETEPVSSN